MNKAISILMLTGTAYWAAQANDVKQPITYNAQATQKLQEKLNTLGADPDYKILADIEFLKALDQLILQGGNPNTYRQHDKNNDKDDTATVLLFGAPMMIMLSGKHVDYPLIESMIQHSLQRCGSIDQGGDKGGKILIMAPITGVPNMVQLALDHGADVTYKDQAGDSALSFIELEIERFKELSTLHKSAAMGSSIQKRLNTLEQIRNMLQAAEQKK